jgi:hypothetical protein
LNREALAGARVKFEDNEHRIQSEIADWIIEWWSQTGTKEIIFVTIQFGNGFNSPNSNVKEFKQTQAKNRAINTLRASNQISKFKKKSRSTSSSTNGFK